MTGYDDLTDEQVEAFENAAAHVAKARGEAVEMLRRAGIEPRERGMIVPCNGSRPTPRPHRCGCTEYEPLGSDRCVTKYNGPDLGSGPIVITCQHGEAEHISI